MDFEILYEDEYLIAFNKPAGIMVHHDTHTKEGTLADWIIKNRSDLIGIGENTYDQKGKAVPRPGIVHRIDKDTSGVILVAKNKDAFEYLKNSFKKREVKKTYRAIVYGEMDKEKGVIDKPIARSKTDFRKKAVRESMVNKAREAVTEYKVLNKGAGYSYVEVYPLTGRTHQIRVHLNSIGHPVVCDSLYAGGRECPQTLKRLALHALEIELTLPNKTRIAVSAPEPKEFKEFLAEAGTL
jgi:23S rRNA pseudouridine1911/1915/1917 synthase